MSPLVEFGEEMMMSSHATCVLMEANAGGFLVSKLGVVQRSSEILCAFEMQTSSGNDKEEGKNAALFFSPFSWLSSGVSSSHTR